MKDKDLKVEEIEQAFEGFYASGQRILGHRRLT